MALGVTVGEQRGMQLVGHGGADAGYRSYTGRFPDHAFAIAVLCNAAPTDPSGLAAKVEALYLKAFAKPAPAPMATARPPRRSCRDSPDSTSTRSPATSTFVTLKDTGLVVGRTNWPGAAPVARQPVPRLGNDRMGVRA